jgi:hypothetical protein
MFRVKVLGLPVSSDETSHCKVCSIVLMFFLPLNLGFKSLLSITPFFQSLLQFLVSSLLLDFPVLSFVPDSLNLLLFQVFTRIVVHVVRSPFKPVLSFENYGISSCVKMLEGMRSYRFFVVFKHRLSLSCNISQTHTRGYCT